MFAYGHVSIDADRKFGENLVNVCEQIVIKNLLNRSKKTPTVQRLAGCFAHLKFLRIFYG